MKKGFCFVIMFSIVLSFAACSSDDIVKSEPGEIECESCNGAGRISCYNCNNTGFAGKYETGLPAICESCGGASRNSCRDCDGTGVQEGYYITRRDGSRTFRATLD